MDRRGNNFGLSPKFSMSIPVTLRMPNALSSYSVTTVSSSSASSVASSRSGSDTKHRPLLPDFASAPAAVGRVTFSNALPDEIKPICKIEPPDLKLLLMLSFPMKLHLMLEKCGWEPPKRTKRKRSNMSDIAPGKRQKNGEEKRDTDSVSCSTLSTLSTESINDAARKTHKTNKDADNRNDNTAGKTTQAKTEGGTRGTRTDGTTNNRNPKIIGWVSGGKAFRIYDEERFTREIMSVYFLGHTSGNSNQPKSFQDFQRNLDLWGFTDMQCIEGPPMRRIHICSHPSFARGQTNACRAMRYRLQNTKTHLTTQS